MSSSQFTPFVAGAGVAGAKVNERPTRQPDLVGSPLLVQLKMPAFLGDKLQIIPAKLGHVLPICARPLKPLEGLLILLHPVAGDHLGVHGNELQDLTAAEGEVDFCLAVVEADRLHVVGPCRQLRRLEGASPVSAGDAARHDTSPLRR